MMERKYLQRIFTAKLENTVEVLLAAVNAMVASFGLVNLHLEPLILHGTQRELQLE